MGLVNRGSYLKSLSTPRTITELRIENRRKRLEILFNEPGLKIEDIIVAIGEKEIEKEIERLEEHKAKLEEEKKERLSLKEIKDEIKQRKEEFANIVKEINDMKDQHNSGIDSECENLAMMLKDIVGHNEYLEKEFKRLTEELEQAKKDEEKMKEDLVIARNNHAIEQEKRNQSQPGSNRNGGNSSGSGFPRRNGDQAKPGAWSDLRNGVSKATNMSDMMKNGKWKK